MIDIMLDDLNYKIQSLQNRIETNEHLQSAWVASRGYENPSLLEKHEKMMDEMEELLRKRRGDD